jgi:integrase
MPIRKMKQEKYNGISELYRGSDGKTTGLYIAYRNVEGKVIRERVDTLNPDKALLKLNQIKFETKRAKDRGDITTATIVKKNPLIIELADAFFVAKVKNSNNTKEQQRFNNHIKPFVETMKCDDLRPMNITAIRDALLAKSLSPKTVNCATDLFRSIMRFGLENQYTSREFFAFDSYKPLPVDNQVERVFTKEEIRTLTQSIDEPRLKLFITMGYFTAQRPESLLRLQRKDIADGKIHISAIKKQKAHYIGIHPELALLLDEWMKDLESDDFIFHTHADNKKGLSYERLQNECSVLFEPYNLPLYWKDGMTAEEVNQAKQQAFKTQRKKWVSLYSLRHSSATNMLEATGDISMVSSILNHSTVTMTQRYAKATDESKARGINAL